jgi:hypothetical protein
VRRKAIRQNQGQSASGHCNGETDERRDQTGRSYKPLQTLPHGNTTKGEPTLCGIARSPESSSHPQTPLGRREQVRRGWAGPHCLLSSISSMRSSPDGISDGIGVGTPRTTPDASRGQSSSPNSQGNAAAYGGRHAHREDRLQNRWSASLAMSTDGSFPSRPRHCPLRGHRPRPSLADSVRD